MIILHLFALVSLFSTGFAAPQVQLGHTTLIGTDTTLPKQEFFGGIPFAEPPLGGLRFEPPVLKTSLNASTFDASNFGLACLQLTLPPSQVSEDCLTINVLRPAGVSPDAALPVLAWIYGGGYIEGDASMYNGSLIVSQSMARGTPIIYVNFNYRLGPLGFPQGQEADSRHALNLGIKDSVVALQWIQANIGAFGGDKSKVTVFGESAGSATIQVLYFNSQLETLVRGAIMESGSGSLPIFNAELREANWQNLVAAVPECASVAKTQNTFQCMQAANTSAIFQAFVVSSASSLADPSPWPPVLDGPNGIIPDLPSNLFLEGHFARVPFIAGTNLDEATLFTPQTINSSDEIREAIIAGSTPSPLGPVPLATVADEILALYSDNPALGSPFNTGNNTFGLSGEYKRFAAVFDDLNFQSGRRLWIQTATNLGVKAYGYLFADPGAQPAPGLITVPPAPGSIGITHSSEIAYVYGTFLGLNTTSNPLSERMMDYWISFASSLDPNDGHGSQRPDWTQYTAQNQVIIQLIGQNTTLIPDNYRAQQIAFMNANNAVFSR